MIGVEQSRLWDAPPEAMNAYVYYTVTCGGHPKHHVSAASFQAGRDGTIDLVPRTAPFATAPPRPYLAK